MIKHIINFFDQLEDKARSRLSKFPVLYALIGGFGIALFWHSVTELATAVTFMNQWHSLPWLIVSMVLLLASGVFVSYFIGDQIIISGMRGEKKIIERTKEEILEEEGKIDKILKRLEAIENKLDELALIDKK